MRAIIFVLITSFLLSSVANAAMLCCWDMGDETAQTETPPCHETEQADSIDADNSDQQALDCECDSCLQKSFTSPIQATAQPVKNNLEPNSASDLSSPDLEPLHTPPIRIS